MESGKWLTIKLLGAISATTITLAFIVSFSSPAVP